MKKMIWFLTALAIMGVSAYAVKVDSTMFVFLEDASSNILWSGDKLTIVQGGELEVRSGATLDLAAGTIPLASRAETSLAKFDVPLENFTALSAGGSFSGFYLEGGTGAPIVKTTDVDNTTATETTTFVFRIPNNYIPGEDVKFSMSTKYIITGDAVAGASNDIDVICREISQTAGTTGGADICATNAIAVTSSYAVKLFTITSTDLVAGDLLKVTVNLRVHDSDAGAGTIASYILAPHFQCDVY